MLSRVVRGSRARGTGRPPSSGSGPAAPRAGRSRSASVLDRRRRPVVKTRQFDRELDRFPPFPRPAPRAAGRPRVAWRSAMERRVIDSPLARSSSSTTPCRPRTCAVSTRRPSATSGMPRATSPGRRRSRTTAGCSPTSWSTVYGSPLWDRLCERDQVELNRRMTAWRLSVLVYGEQGALLACSQLVNIVAGHRREVLPGHPGRGRGAPQRGARAIPPGAARWPPLPDAGQRAHPVRRHPERPSLVHQDDRAPARRRDVRRLPVQDDGGVRARSAPRPGLPAHSAGRVAPHGVRHARPARDRAGGERPGAAGDGGLHLRSRGKGPHGLLPARRVPRLRPVGRPDLGDARRTGGTWRRGTTTRCTGSTSSATCTRRWSATWPGSGSSPSACGPGSPASASSSPRRPSALGGGCSSPEAPVPDRVPFPGGGSRRQAIPPAVGAGVRSRSFLASARIRSGSGSPPLG